MAGARWDPVRLAGVRGQVGLAAGRLTQPEVLLDAGVAREQPPFEAGRPARPAARRIWRRIWRASIGARRSLGKRHPPVDPGLGPMRTREVAPEWEQEGVMPLRAAGRQQAAEGRQQEPPE